MQIRNSSQWFQVLILPLALLCASTWAQDPAKSQYHTTILMKNLSDPTHMAFLPDGRVYVTTKPGTVFLYDPATKQTVTAATIRTANLREDGLHSIVLDPNFASNHRVYMLFSSIASGDSSNVVARFTALTSGLIDTATRQILLKIPYTFFSGSGSNLAEHTDGSLTFGPGGNLYIGLPDNSQNIFSGNGTGSSPRDPSRPLYDSQRSASNSNDLRGKILRIHPEDNGTYTIPAGNLWEYINQPSFNPNWNAAVDSISKVRKEIYTMGNRHPFRMAIDSVTGWLYWAEPGPNATADNALTGPRGYEEVNLAKNAGYYGWPYCIANNFCYTQYNYQSNTGGATYVSTALQNNSINNTGIHNLPPARPALVWYPYNSTGTAFPVFGSGNVNTGMLGPIYHFNPALQSSIKLPQVFDRNIFIVEWSRSLIFAGQLDTSGQISNVRSFWSTRDSTSDSPIDVKVGPDGALYFLNWVGTSYTNNSNNGTLTRLEYTGPPTGIGNSWNGSSPLFHGLQVFGLRPRLLLPPGATGLDLYDLKGVRVWSYRRSGASMGEAVDLPASIGTVLQLGVLRVRYP